MQSDRAYTGLGYGNGSDMYRTTDNLFYFDEKQKLQMKENLHEWADTVMQGFKKRLRESGRLIES